MKNQQPHWLKIVYIIFFLAVAGYTYWQQNQNPDADAGNGVAGNGDAVGAADDNLDPTLAMKDTPLGDRVSQRNSENSKTQSSGNKASDGGRSDSKTTETSSNPAAEYGVNSFEWSKVERNNFTSPQGLVYGMGPRNEHRLEHVFRHAADQPNRPGPHGVFDGDHDEILANIDSAYKLVKFRSSDVDSKTEGNRKTHLINMKKRIGYIGGQTGKRKNNPPAKKIRIVVEGTRVITAFPLWILAA